MLIFTQSYRDSGFEGLIPLGFIFAKSWYTDRGDTDEIIKYIEKTYSEMKIDFVFNSKFEWYLLGHPSNDKMYGCHFSGDAYKLTDESKEEYLRISNNKQVLLEPGKVRPGWQYRCGLVTLGKQAWKS